MEKIFDFDWLNASEYEITGDADKNDLEIKFEDYSYPLRFGTSEYTGYIITAIDMDTEDKLAFNCDKYDTQKENLESTYIAIRERFSIKSNGACFRRKNLRLLSVTVPKEKFIDMIDHSNKVIKITNKDQYYKKKVLY